MYPTASARAHQQHRVQSYAKNSTAYEFFSLLTGPDLLNQLEDKLPEHRERLFPPTETLSMFLAQAIECGSVWSACSQ